MSEKNANREKIGFFEKMKTAENKGFEISMFVISIVLALAVVISVIWLGIYFRNASAAKITDEEANANSVTESAVVQDDDEPMPTPDGKAVVSDSDDYESDIDPELKDAKFGYTTAVVNLRSSASLTASVVTKVPMGVRLKFFGMNDDDWMEVSYKGQRGFIHARYLSTTKVEPLATVKPSTQPQEPDEPEPDETDEPADDTPQPTEEPTAKPTAEPTERPTKEPAPTPDITKKPDVVSAE